MPIQCGRIQSTVFLFFVCPREPVHYPQTHVHVLLYAYALLLLAVLADKSEPIAVCAFPPLRSTAACVRAVVIAMGAHANVGL